MLSAARLAGRGGDERELRPVAGQVDRHGVRAGQYTPAGHGPAGWTSAARLTPAQVVSLPFYKRTGRVKPFAETHGSKPSPWASGTPQSLRTA